MVDCDSLPPCKAGFHWLQSYGGSTLSEFVLLRDDVAPHSLPVVMLNGTCPPCREKAEQQKAEQQAAAELSAEMATFTAADAVALGAQETCRSDLALFRAAFPNGVPISVEGFATALESYGADSPGWHWLVSALPAINNPDPAVAVEAVRAWKRERLAAAGEGVA